MSELIAYYSRAGENYFSGTLRRIETGNTEIAAKELQNLTGAELFKIEQIIPYSDGYNDCIKEAQADQHNGARPALKNLLESISGYSVIYLGYPNYWGTMPMAVFTFLESYDFSGKTIRPFCTHEGSGMGRSESDIKKICPGADVRKGLDIKGSAVLSSGDAFRKWL